MNKKNPSGKISRFIAVIITIVLLSILFITFAQAKIVLSGHNEQYNLGDEIKQDIKIITTDSFSGFLKASLVCDNVETLLFLTPFSLEKNKEKSFSFSFIASNSGKCSVSAILERDKVKIEATESQEFVITNRINLDINLNKQFFMPEQKLKISGKAIMANNQYFDGKAEIFVQNKNYSVVVSRGEFILEIILDKDIAPGKHQLRAELNDDKNNFGSAEIEFEIGVVKTSLQIKTNLDIVNPEELLLITPVLLDQANGTIEENVSVRLIKIENIGFGMQKKNILLEEIINSGASTKYKFSEYAEPQDYIISAESAGFKTEKIIIVPKIEKINYTIINLGENSGTDSSLFVKNIGNVRYQKPLELEFTIENITLKRIVDVDLETEKEKIYSLNSFRAPNGLYDITIKSQGETKSFSDIPLTGKVSTILNLEKLEVVKDKFWILPLFLILAFLVILIFIRRNLFLTIFKTKNKKKKIPEKVYGFEVYNREFSEEKNKKNEKEKGIISKSKKLNEEKTMALKMSDIKKKEFERKKDIASSKDLKMFSSKLEVMKGLFDKYSGLLTASIVPGMVSGKKQDICVLMIRINNLNKLANLKNSDTFLFNELADTYFSKIIKKIAANNGVANFYDNHFIIFFNIISQLNPAMTAVKTAQEIKRITEELNQDLSLKAQVFQLSISAGIHFGQAVLTSPGLDKTIKYSPLAGTTSIAKALEKKAFQNEILISDVVFNQIGSSILTKKTTPVMEESGAMNSYIIREKLEEKKDTPYWMK